MAAVAVGMAAGQGSRENRERCKPRTKHPPQTHPQALAIAQRDEWQRGDVATSRLTQPPHSPHGRRRAPKNSPGL
eukprot:1646552-Alexandrium_andersonii.AAC.1